MLQALRKAELNLWVMTFYAVFFNMLVDNGITMCLVIYLFIFIFLHKKGKKKGFRTQCPRQCTYWNSKNCNSQQNILACCKSTVDNISASQFLLNVFLAIVAWNKIGSIHIQMYMLECWWLDLCNLCEFM